MSEHTPEWDDEPAADGADAAASSQEFADPVRTGVEEVDGVLDSVERLEDRPVDEHVAVFENAHEQLRRALDGPGDGGHDG